MLKIKLGILVVSTLILSGCGSFTSEYTLIQNEQELPKVAVAKGSIEYRILPQDRLKVLLYRNPQQNTDIISGELGQNMDREGILVDASGNIVLPLVGKVKVAGQTQSQVADRITEQYKIYLNEPSVYVEVLNKRIYVLGEVNNPGVVKLDKEKMTLFEAIAFSGDLTTSAVRDNIIIVSSDPKKGLTMRSVDLTNFNTIHYASLMLRPNDIVYVQPDGWKEFKIKSDNLMTPFQTITSLAAPFVTLKYLTD